jgi:hypothetical protein
MSHEFQPLKGTSTPITRELALRTLSDQEYMLFEYLKKRIPVKDRVPRVLKINDMAYNLHSTYWKVLNAKNGLKKKGLIEAWTVTFRDPAKGQGFFTKKTYYRIKK